MSSQAQSSSSVSIDKFNGKNEKAHSTILLSLFDEVLYEVVDEETAVEGSIVKDHLDALYLILMDLKNVEVNIDDEDAALILLVLLPPVFKNFVKSFVVATGHDRGRCRTHKGKGKGRYEDRLKSRPRGSNPRDTCNYCKEEGHWKFNIPKLKEKVG
ncbi:retrovirus-related pol polyprotein from transposon TNT 1-94 [Tanacetum coccineum]